MTATRKPYRAVHGGVDRTRQDRVDPDVARPELGGQRLSETDQAGLARGIGGGAWEREAVADEGRGEDHRTAAMLLHLAEVLGAEERAGACLSCATDVKPLI